MLSPRRSELILPCVSTFGNDDESASHRVFRLAGFALLCYPWLALSGRSPEESQEEAPGVLSTTLQGSATFFSFEESSTSMGRLCRVLWIVIASQLWLAPFLRISSDECTISRGRTADGRVRFECLFLAKRVSCFVSVRGSRCFCRFLLSEVV